MGSALQIRVGAPVDPMFSAMGVIATFGNTTIDADGEGMAMAYRFDCTGTSDTITHVGYRKGTVTGTPAANSYDAMIQGVGTDGLLDGADKGGGSPTLKQFTPSTTSNIWEWVQLTNSLAVNRDVIIAAVVKANSNITASNNIQIANSYTGQTMRHGVPYVLVNTTGAFVRNGGALPCMAFKSASAVYGYPMKINVANAYGSTTEAGFWFNIPTHFCSTFKVVGAEIDMTSPASGASTHYATIYSNPLSGSIAIQQQSSAWDVDQLAAAGSTRRFVRITFDTAYSLPALSAGTDYVLGLATTTASAGALNSLSVDSAGDWEAWPGGQQFGYTSRTLTSYPPDTDTNNFAAVTTAQRPYINLILSDLTAPVGGGGSANLFAGKL